MRAKSQLASTFTVTAIKEIEKIEEKRLLLFGGRFKTKER